MVPTCRPPLCVPSYPPSVCPSFPPPSRPMAYLPVLCSGMLRCGTPSKPSTFAVNRLKHLSLFLRSSVFFSCTSSCVIPWLGAAACKASLRPPGRLLRPLEISADQAASPCRSSVYLVLCGSRIASRSLDAPGDPSGLWRLSGGLTEGSQRPVLCSGMFRWAYFLNLPPGLLIA